MKKLLSLLLALALLAGFAGCAGPGETPATPAATQTAPALETTPEPTADPDAPRIFTDSSGRAVEVPANIATIAVTGPLAQIVVFALAPDLLAGIASEWDEAAALYLDAGYYELPVLGQLYGGKGELNLETLLASGAEVVIDVGEAKSTIVEDMDSLQAQTGIPFVHIDATVQTMGAAYAMLGELLNMREQAAALAEYCDAALAKAQAVAHGAEPVKLLYVTGAEGHNVIAKGSYHAGVIDMLSDNLAAVAEPGKGTGNEVDMGNTAWNRSSYSTRRASTIRPAPTPHGRGSRRSSPANTTRRPSGRTTGWASRPRRSSTWACSGWRSCSIRTRRITTSMRRPNSISACSTIAT